MKKILQQLLLVFLVSLSTSAWALDDNYLNALEVEAEDTSHTKVPAEGGGNSVDSGLKEEFENMLEARKPATYKFYKKLNADNKAKIVKFHQKEQKISVTSKKIFDLYFAQSK